MATVTECRYDFGAGRALAFGAPSSKHFRIRYNYFAEGELHSGELTSAKAMPQDMLFHIRYNPDAAHEHTHEHSTPPNPRRVQILIGIVGSVILSFAWLFLLRSCH
jgi:hypothetical protein